MDKVLMDRWPDGRWTLFDQKSSDEPIIKCHIHIYKMSPTTVNRWLPWSLIGQDIFNFFSRTSACEVGNLARIVLPEDLEKYCCFSM
jgi:hypothetical protein